jgi:hypothetical protein
MTRGPVRRCGSGVAVATSTATSISLVVTDAAAGTTGAAIAPDDDTPSGLFSELESWWTPDR